MHINKIKLNKLKGKNMDELELIFTLNVCYSLLSGKHAFIRFPLQLLYMEKI